MSNLEQFCEAVSAGDTLYVVWRDDVPALFEATVQDVWHGQAFIWVHWNGNHQVLSKREIWNNGWRLSVEDALRTSERLLLDTRDEVRGWEERFDNAASHLKYYKYLAEQEAQELRTFLSDYPVMLDEFVERGILPEEK